MNLPRFGGRFREAALPDVHKYAPPVAPKAANQDGYDGQFYAQIALDQRCRGRTEGGM